MSALELKNDILQIISQTDDINILAMVKEALTNSTQKKEDGDWWDTLSDEQKKAVEQGQKDIKANRVFTNQEVKDSIRAKIEAFKNK